MAILPENLKKNTVQQTFQIGPTLIGSTGLGSDQSSQILLPKFGSAPKSARVVRMLSSSFFRLLFANSEIFFNLLGSALFGSAARRLSSAPRLDGSALQFHSLLSGSVCSSNARFGSPLLFSLALFGSAARQLSSAPRLDGSALQFHSLLNGSVAVRMIGSAWLSISFSPRLYCSARLGSPISISPRPLCCSSNARGLPSPQSCSNAASI